MGRYDVKGSHHVTSVACCCIQKLRQGMFAAPAAIVVYFAPFIVLFTSRAAGRAKAARLVQEYTN